MILYLSLKFTFLKKMSALKSVYLAYKVQVFFFFINHMSSITQVTKFLLSMRKLYLKFAHHLLSFDEYVNGDNLRDM